MGTIISFIGLKGGVGKSTLARHCADALHADGHKALIIDTDTRNRSCLGWAAAAAERGREGPPVVMVEAAALRRDLPGHAKRYDAIFVDTAAQLGPDAVHAMIASHLCVLPTTPNADDLNALAGTLSHLAQARVVRPDLLALVVINCNDRTVISREAEGKARETAEEHGVELCEVIVGRHVVVREANAAGAGVASFRPTSDAAREVRRLCKELLGAVARGAKR